MACRPSTPTSLRPHRRPTSSSRPQVRHVSSRPPPLQLLHARLSVVHSSALRFLLFRVLLHLCSFPLLSCCPLRPSCSYSLCLPHITNLAFLSSLSHINTRVPLLSTLFVLLRYTLSLMLCLSQQVGRAERARKREKGSENGRALSACKSHSAESFATHPTTLTLTSTLTLLFTLFLTLTMVRLVCVWWRRWPGRGLVARTKLARRIETPALG